MNTKLILTAITGFAAAVNKHITTAELAIRVDAVTVTGDKVSASLVTTQAGKSHSGSLIEVEVATGTAESVTARLAKIRESNSYWHVIATAPMLKEDPDGDGAKKAPSAKMFALFARVQP